MSNKLIVTWGFIFCLLMFFTGCGFSGILFVVITCTIWIALKGFLRGDYLDNPNENADLDKWSQYYADGINHKGLNDAQARERAERIVNGTKTYAYSTYKMNADSYDTQKKLDEEHLKRIERWEKGKYVDFALKTSDLRFLGQNHYFKSSEEYLKELNKMTENGTYIEDGYRYWYPAYKPMEWFPEEYKEYYSYMESRRKL